MAAERESVNFELLLKHASSPGEVNAIKGLQEHGSRRKAAEALGVNPSTVDRAILRVQKRAGAVDRQAHDGNAPAGYIIPKVTTQINAHGEIVNQWVRTAREGQDPAILLDVFRQAVEDAPPRVRSIIPPPDHQDKDLLACYTMGDPHIGMLSWGLETGTDFDLKIAERHLVQATQKLVALAPPAKRAGIFNLGDFFHADDNTGRTARSGHILDTDSRWAKVLQVGARAKIACIEAVLEKHEIVDVFVVPGNHDDHSSVFLNMLLIHHFRNNPRVIFREVLRAFQYLEFGANLIGTAHGHTVKGEKLPGIMAQEMPEAWGRTRHRHWFCGHVHHYSAKEYNGVLVETFNTLAGRDAWTHSSGFLSDRNMVLNVHHKTRGRILTHRVGIEDLV